MARDETAGTWRTPLLVLAGCFTQEYPVIPASSGSSCSGSDMRRPDWDDGLAGSAVRLFVGLVQELVEGQGAALGGAAGGEQVDGDLAGG